VLCADELQGSSYQQGQEHLQGDHREQQLIKHHLLDGSFCNQMLELHLQALSCHASESANI